jgi:hypothetical protein
MSVEEHFSSDEIAEARQSPLVIRWSDEAQLFLVSLPDFGGVTSHGRPRRRRSAE